MISVVLLRESIVKPIVFNVFVAISLFSGVALAEVDVATACAKRCESVGQRIGVFICQTVGELVKDDVCGRNLPQNKPQNLTGGARQAASPGGGATGGAAGGNVVGGAAVTTSTVVTGAAVVGGLLIVVNPTPTITHQ